MHSQVLLFLSSFGTALNRRITKLGVFKALIMMHKTQDGKNVRLRTKLEDHNTYMARNSEGHGS